MRSVSRLGALWDYPRGRCSLATRRSVVPAPQHRTPGPGRSLDSGRTGRRGERSCSTRTNSAGRHDRTVGGGRVGERRAPRAAALSDAGSDWRTWGSGESRLANSCRIGSRGASSCPPRGRTTTQGSSTAAIRNPRREAAYDAPNRDMELRYHRLGTDPADDPLVFATPDEPEWGFEPEVSDDGDLLVVSVGAGRTPRTGSTSPT